MHAIADMIAKLQTGSKYIIAGVHAHLQQLLKPIGCHAETYS